MLSDPERARLEEIQDQLLAEDPGLVQTFEAMVQPSSTTPRKPTGKLPARQFLLWSAIVLGVLLLLAGSVGGALAIAMVGVALLMAHR